MPVHDRVEEWYNAGRRQPGHYADGYHHVPKESQDRRPRHASKSLERRRRSSQHGHHVDYETMQQDSWETMSEEEVGGMPRHQAGKRRPKAKKCACSDCRESHLHADEFEHSEEEWWDAERYGKEHAQAEDYFSHPGQEHDVEWVEEDSPDEEVVHGHHYKPKSHRPGNHRLVTRPSPRTRSQRRRSYPYSLHSGEEDAHHNHDRHVESARTKGSLARPLGEHRLHHTIAPPMPIAAQPWHIEDAETSEDEEEDDHMDVRKSRSTQSARHQTQGQKSAMRRKSSRVSYRVPGAFSDDEDHVIQKPSMRRQQSEPYSQKGRPSKGKLVNMTKEHGPHRVEAPSPPPLTSRPSFRKVDGGSSELPFRAPKLGRSAKQDKSKTPMHQMFGGEITLTTPEETLGYLRPDDELTELKSRPGSYYGRPKMPRAASENILMRPNTAMPGYPRFESGKLRVDNKPWKHTSSMTSSNDLSHVSGSFSSVPGGVGSKAYAYNSLEHKSDFRLIRVLPERTAKLKCKILHSTLDDPPDYIAISYAWGDGVDTKRLILDGSTISVAASLHDALRAVRDKDDEILVWIDGLSIDQNNKAERASQVGLMSQIYGNAKFVAVWLGPHAEDSQLAIPLLEEIAKGKVSKKRIRAVSNPDSWALRNLFKREFWNRLWVVQEVFLAQEIWVFCGSSQLPWEAYKIASDSFWEQESDPHLRQGPSNFPDMGSFVGMGTDSLLEVLRACRKKVTENPRDKIFGLLGILPEETRKEIPVNYDQPVKALYIDVADHIISSTRRLDVIRESIHFPLYSSSAGLPSWCPECKY